MRVWTLAGGTMAALGALALVVASSAGVVGQQRTFTVTAGPAGDQGVVIKERGPVQLLRTLSEADGPRIGVSIRDVVADDVTKMKLPAPSGVVVDDVEKDGPAAKAGLQKGDTIVSFDGESVRSVAQFRRLVRESVAGRSVKASVLRDGKRVEVAIAPAEAKDRDVQVWMDEPRLRERVEPDGEALRRELRQFRVPRGEFPRFDFGPMTRFHWEGDGPVFDMFVGQRGRLGVMLQDLSPALAEFFGVKEGALVASVNKDTPAEKAGIKAGDVITAIDGKTVTAAGDVAAQLREKSGEISVSVVRDKKALNLKATIEKPADAKPKVMNPGFPG
jgi:S1-C subfamily serine protease